MDCLMHQVLVAMLTVTPASDAPSITNSVKAPPRAVVSAPVKAKRPTVALGGKTKAGDQVVQVTVPRPAVN